MIEVPCAIKGRISRSCVHAYCRFVYHSRLAIEARIEWENELKKKKEEKK